MPPILWNCSKLPCTVLVNPVAAAFFAIMFWAPAAYVGPMVMAGDRPPPTKALFKIREPQSARLMYMNASMRFWMKCTVLLKKYRTPDRERFFSGRSPPNRIILGFLVRWPLMITLPYTQAWAV